MDFLRSQHSAPPAETSNPAVMFIIIMFVIGMFGAGVYFYWSYLFPSNDTSPPETTPPTTTPPTTTPPTTTSPTTTPPTTTLPTTTPPITTPPSTTPPTTTPPTTTPPTTAPQRLKHHGEGCNSVLECVENSVCLSNICLPKLEASTSTNINEYEIQFKNPKSGKLLCITRPESNPPEAGCNWFSRANNGNLQIVKTNYGQCFGPNLNQYSQYCTDNTNADTKWDYLPNGTLKNNYYGIDYDTPVRKSIDAGCLEISSNGTISGGNTACLKTSGENIWVPLYIRTNSRGPVVTV